MRVVAQNYVGYYLDDTPIPFNRNEMDGACRKTLHLACGIESLCLRKRRDKKDENRKL